MIQYRRTFQISPGRQSDAIDFMREFASDYEHVTGVHVRMTVVTTGTLGRICHSADYDSMSAWEAAETKMWADPKGVELSRRFRLHQGDGTSPFVPNTWHDEFWRDA